MVRATLEENLGPHTVDLTGGQPDLAPEWPVWFLQDLDRFSESRVYVWSDDNLSTDYLWRYLSAEQLDLLGDHSRYGRACCIKGFDSESFTFNTRAKPELFDHQFDLLSRIRHETEIDYYVYLTITSPSTDDLRNKIRNLVDRLQWIGEYVPLRCVPLKIVEWGPVAPRMTPTTAAAIRNQHSAVTEWTAELDRRFPGVSLSVVDAPR